MERPNEGQEINLTEFIENLRELSVADQKAVDHRYIWKRDGKEFSGYPEVSEKFIGAVVEAIKNYPDEFDKIANAVNKFLDISVGTDGINKAGVLDRANDLGNLWKAEEKRANLWQKVAFMMK